MYFVNILSNIFYAQDFSMSEILLNSRTFPKSFKEIYFYYFFN